MTAYRFDHFHLICSDLERTERFFADVLGARLVRRQRFGTAGGAILDLHGAPIYLREAQEGETITDAGTGKRYGYDHLGFEVDDLDAACREVEGAGFAFTVPPVSAGDGKIAFFKGPDDITIELFQPGSSSR
ncbi:MAG: VOC family protein [Deltaproteobacteria bacterium]|nr:VOC family protein [Deltaproteobacteria bacterium]